MDPFVAYLHNAINQPSGRKELLQWMNKHFSTISKKTDLKPLIKDVLSCIDDKSKEVRALAEPLLAEIARRGNVKAVEEQISKLKPATAAPLRALLQTITTAPAPSASGVKTPSKVAGARDRAPTTTNMRLSELPPTSGKSDNEGASPRSMSPHSHPDADSASSDATVESLPVTSLGPILRNTGKQVREKSASVPAVWLFDTVTPQLVSTLRAQATECVSENLLEKMFGATAGDYYAAATEVDGSLESCKDAVLDRFVCLFGCFCLFVPHGTLTLAFALLPSNCCPGSVYFII
jgi:cytoskeleton-associated protein 5